LSRANDRVSHAISDRARAYNASHVNARQSSITAISGFGIFEVEPELAANLCKAMIAAWAMTKFLLDCCKERRVRNYFHMANLGAEMPTVY
jgi:hypothetical protein